MDFSAQILISGLAVAVTLVIQTVAVVWFFARLSARVEHTERDTSREITRIWNEIKTISERQAGHPDRLVKLETLLFIVQQQQDDIKLKLDELREGQLTRNAAIDQRYKRYEDTNNLRSGGDGG